MPITFQCHSCNASLTVPNAFAGRVGRCPKCAARVVATPGADGDEELLEWVPAAVFDWLSVKGTAAAHTATPIEPPTPAVLAPAAPPPAVVAPAVPVNAAPKQRKPTESWGGPPAIVPNEPPPEEAPAAEAVEGARLTVVSEGRFQGVVYPIGQARCAVIGRDPKNEVAIPSGAISRHHCQIERSGDDYILTDLGSANGTLVNSEHTVSKTIKDGDYIQVGDTLLLFQDE